MRRSVAVAIALVAVLTASSLAALPGTVRSAPVHPTGSFAPMVGFNSVNPTDRYGGYTSDFYVGYAEGIVYFSAYDDSDTSAVVQINDQNATRDGFVNPVLSETVSFSSGFYNNSYLWDNYYKIPFTLQRGGWWNITINGTNAGFSSTSFYVHTYTVSVQPTQPAYLADHTGRVLYYVDATVNNAPWSNLSSVTVTANYLTTTGTTATLPGTPMDVGTAGWGSFNFTVPSDANSFGGIHFDVFANLSATTPATSEQGFAFAPVGSVNDPSVSLATCPSGCYSTTFVSGTPVYVLVQASIDAPGVTTPAPGLTAQFQYNSGASPVTPTGGAPTSVTTNASGGAAVLFIASAAVFSTTQTDSVVVTLHDPVDPSAVSVSTTVQFDVVLQSAGTARLQVLLDATQYFGGDTATATWEIGGLNSSIAQGWTADGWWVWELGTGTLVASGTLGQTGTQGTFTFAVPTGYGGQIEVTVEAHNATSSLYDYDTAEVSAPAIFLTPSEAEYLAGDSVTVSVSTQGQIFSGAQLWQSVVDSSGNTLVSGPLNGSTISFSIPKVGAPNDVTVSVAAQTSAGIVGQASIILYEGSGIEITAGVTTLSNYADGSFQPGQTISVAYTISPVGTATLPKTFEVTIYPTWSFFGPGYGSKVVQTSSPSGSIDFTIPSGIAAGAQSFTVEARLGSCTFGCYAVTSFAVNVNPSPSALSYQLGAGSGVTVGWVVLLVLILLVAVVLFLAIRRRGRPMVMKPHSGSSSPTASWQETPPSSGGSSSGGSGGAGGSGGSDSPPLPKPQ